LPPKQRQEDVAMSLFRSPRATLSELKSKAT